MIDITTTTNRCLIMKIDIETIANITTTNRYRSDMCVLLVDLSRARRPKSSWEIRRCKHAGSTMTFDAYIYIYNSY